VLTDLDAALRKLAISPTSEPCALFEDANIWYAQQSDPGDLATPSPVIVMGYQVLPSGLAFWAADPVSGAPLPVDVDDANGLRFLALGHRCTLRGWIGTVADTLTGILKARWNDTVARNPADPRGAWTGVVVFSFDGERQAADQLAASLQGKRPGDANWLDYGCHLNRPIDPAGTESHASAPSADTDAGSLRVIVTGASPAWTVNIEKWDTAGMVWAVVHSVVIDLRANGVPGSLTGYGLIGALVSAATVPNPGGPWPPVAPYDTQEIAIDRVEVSQFEPWVPDIAEWSRLDWQHMLAAIGLTFPVNTSSLELRRAPVDLLHMPMGHAAAPAELRASDADLGIGVRMTKDTTLWAQGRNDTPLMSIVAGARDLAICAQDAASCGYEAPFAAAVEIKPENMVAWVTDRWILQIDNPLEGAPNAASNGMGVFWRAADEKLVARAYHDGVGWVDLTYDFPRATWGGRAVTIAICWSGYSYGAGNTAGRPDYEFRLVVDGVTRASTVIGVNFRLQHAGPSVTVGAGNGGDGFTGFFSQGALFGEVMGDLDIRAAFEEAQSDFANPEFEDPAVSARAGEAEHWLWRSLQIYNAFAEFNTHDATHEQHQGGFEGFEIGWDNDAWIADVADAVLVAAWFNASSALPARAEGFELNWGYNDGAHSGPEWLEAYTEIAAEWRGWYDGTLAPPPTYPLLAESFEEAFGTDPLCVPAGTQGWVADALVSGQLQGNALTFPLTVTYSRRELWFYIAGETAHRMLVTPGIYASSGALETELNVQLVAALGPASGYLFGKWAENGLVGLTFGADAAHHITAPGLMFGEVESNPTPSLRQALGFAALCPVLRSGRLRVARAVMAPPSPLLGASDALVVDPWTWVRFSWATDPNVGGDYTVDDARDFGTFDTAVAEDTVLERFTLHGWYGLAAAWTSAYGPGDLTAAIFDSLRRLEFGAPGYTDAVPTDIGEIVHGGTTGDTGTLLMYNNTTRVWWVLPDAPADLFDVIEAVSITTGIGQGLLLAAADPPVTMEHFSEDTWPSELYPTGP
jgi:hypothetical protein